MAIAYASRVIAAPVEQVWATIRDFNGLPTWHPALRSSEIEEGRPADAVGCIRHLVLQNGASTRERLLELDDARYRLTYAFETPLFPVKNYLATITLIPLTEADHTFVQWQGSFEEAPEDAGKYTAIISKDVYAEGLSALARFLSTQARQAALPERWAGARPAKAYAAAVIRKPLAEVWAKLRDFAALDRLHPDIKNSRMEGGAPSEQVGAIRRFRLGSAEATEQLTALSDVEHRVSYRMLQGPQPWLAYRASVQLYPVSATNETVAVWQGDWTAAPHDDLTLIPGIAQGVYQRIFDTLNAG